MYAKNTWKKYSKKELKECMNFNEDYNDAL